LTTTDQGISFIDTVVIVKLDFWHYRIVVRLASRLCEGLVF